MNNDDKDNGEEDNNDDDDDGDDDDDNDDDDDDDDSDNDNIKRLSSRFCTVCSLYCQLFPTSLNGENPRPLALENSTHCN